MRGSSFCPPPHSHEFMKSCCSRSFSRFQPFPPPPRPRQYVLASSSESRHLARRPSAPLSAAFLFKVVWHLPRRDGRSGFLHQAGPVPALQTGLFHNNAACRARGPTGRVGAGQFANPGPGVLREPPSPLAVTLGGGARGDLVNLWGKCWTSRTSQNILLILCASSL